jgi:hypothetical protein
MKPTPYGPFPYSVIMQATDSKTEEGTV